MSTTRPSGSASEGDLLHSGERFLGRVAALVGGFVLMVIGIGLGVSMVLLPLGIPVGVVGALLFLWALSGGNLLDRRRN